MFQIKYLLNLDSDYENEYTDEELLHEPIFGVISISFNDEVWGVPYNLDKGLELESYVISFWLEEFARIASSIAAERHLEIEDIEAPWMVLNFNINELKRLKISSIKYSTDTSLNINKHSYKTFWSESIALLEFQNEVVQACESFIDEITKSDSRFRNSNYVKNITAYITDIKTN